MRTMKVAMVALALAGTGWTADGPPAGDRPGKGGDRMAAWLDLTPEQSTKLKALMSQHRRATRDLRDRRQDAMRALRYLVEDKGTDAQITAKLGELKAAQEALQAAQKKQRDEAAKILTPMQQAKFVTGMGRHGGKPGRKMMKDGRRGDAPGGPHGRTAMHDDDDDEEDDD